MKNYLIVDGSSILFRSFYALPPMNTTDGKATNALVGFMNILLKAIEMIEPDNIAVCFDLKGKTFRSDIFSSYKANRSPAPEELSEQFIYIKEILNAFSIKYFELEGYEADDLAGTLSKDAEDKGYKVYLLSGDKDYLQLVDKNTSLLYTKTGISDFDEYTVEKIYEDMKISPSQIIDLKALMGDKSDNIPGVDGVGEKTALKLLYEFDNIENLYANTDKLKKNKTNEKIISSKDIAFLSKELATINTKSPIDLDDSKTAYGNYNKEDLADALNKYQLNALINRLNLSSDSSEEIKEEEIKAEKNKSLIDIITEIKKDKIFAFKIFASDKAYLGGKVFKIGIKTKNNYYINDINSLEDFKELFEDESIEKIGYELKEDILHLIHNGIDLKNYTADISLGQYILNPSDNDYSIERLAYLYGVSLSNNMPDKKDLKKSISTWDEDLQDSYLVNILKTIWNVYNLQKEKITEEEMDHLYFDLELPLTKVLADMEYTGVYVDQEELEKIGKDLDSQLEFLIDNIYRLAGEEFNINSPKQLSEILFEKLDLPPVKKTKTGYSTNIEVLEQLEDKHEIISYIIKYRTIAKLKSTYVDGLFPYIVGEEKRIHSSFNQTITATGRISSTEPNLQNIPVRSEEGRELRKIFKAKAGHKLIDADYSQIELRILADISDDKNMLEAFDNNDDIHTTTAAKVFGVEAKDVTPLLRSRAKAVNFGIVYGISDFGLSRDLKIPRAEAKEYIDNYFARFSGVKNYMDTIVKEAKENKFVTTKLGRRRYLPELESRNFNIRSAGERIALNTPIQGTAADIIKIAMVDVYRELEERKFKTKLILQIHDELILEAPIEEVDEVKEILRSKMEDAVELKTKLLVDLEVGDSWYDTK